MLKHISFVVLFAFSLHGYSECDSQWRCSTRHFEKTAQANLAVLGQKAGPFIRLAASAVSGDAQGVWFCDDPRLPEDCTLDQALEVHKLKDPDKIKLVDDTVGQLVVTDEKTGDTFDSTAFLFETEDCKDKNLILTNAHSFFHEPDKIFSRSAKFCLKDLEKNCYELDLSPETIKKLDNKGLIGKQASKSYGEAPSSEDYMVIPLKEKVKTGRVAKLKHIPPSKEYPFEYSKDVFYGGYHFEKGKISKAQCKISHYGSLGGLGGLDMLHNCSTDGGFSGSPLLTEIEEGYQIIAIHSSGNNEESEVYDPDKLTGFNAACAVTPQLIENLNLYCKARNSEDVSN